jgi:23S rRNA (cytosine1962-C5)-methyltransferase
MRSKPDYSKRSSPAGNSVLLDITEGFPDYQMLDSGHGRKLERFATVVVDRPEPQAMWAPRLTSEKWSEAVGVFAGDGDSEKGRWRFRGHAPETWPMQVENISVLCRFTAFRHLGVFPEQHPHWTWMLTALKDRTGEGVRPRLLNLFAYTGVASLLAAANGVDVTHVDASKKAIEWAKQNQLQSQLQHARIRWIIDDARKFSQREVRRGRTYHGILIDPPKFGRGPNGEIWDLFENLPDLLRTCVPLLDTSGAFLILTAYAIRASALSMHLLMKEALSAREGRIQSGELAIREVGGDRAISTSLFSRWTSDVGQA